MIIVDGFLVRLPVLDFSQVWSGWW